MSIFIIEALVAIVVFTIIVVHSVNKDPLAWVEDYPPAIRERVYKLHLAERPTGKISSKFLINKIIKTVVIIVVISLVLVYVNGVSTFTDGFVISYALWFVVAWYDALVIDCIWFAHSRRVVIPGTEDLVKEYHNYWFHIKMSLFGCVLGLPVCALVGLHVMLAGMIM